MQNPTSTREWSESMQKDDAVTNSTYDLQTDLEEQSQNGFENRVRPAGPLTQMEPRTGPSGHRSNHREGMSASTAIDSLASRM